MNKTLSSVDLVALVSEFQILSHAKLQQVYHPDKTEFCLHLHVPGKGKQYLRIIAGKMINFASDKRSSLAPTGLCMSLRKHIGGAIIQKVWQKDAERIIIFDLIRGDLKFHLVVELFSKGNVVLCDSNWQILALQSWQLRKSGAVKMKQEYKFPESRFNWQICSLKEFSSVVSESDKKNLATVLATDMGLGGVFSEEICGRANVDAKLVVSEVVPTDLKKLFVALGSVKKELESPKGYVYSTQISPITLSLTKVGELLEEKESFSDALDLVNPLVKKSPFEAKIQKIEKIISKQTEVIIGIEQDIIDNSRKGDILYEKYSDIVKLQEIVTSMVKSKGWDTVKKELESSKSIVSVDLKKKTVVLDL